MRPLLAILLAVLIPAAAAQGLPEIPPEETTYPDLELAEALTLPRYFVAQDATGNGTSISDPAPMGDLSFDGSDRAVVVVGGSDTRVPFNIAFTDRPGRFALLHASAVDPAYPADEFRKGSIRVDQRDWTSAPNPGLAGVWRTEVSRDIRRFLASYTAEGGFRVPGALYNDFPTLELPEADQTLPVAMVNLAESDNGYEASDEDPDFVAAPYFKAAPSGTFLLILHRGTYLLYVKPRPEHPLDAEPAARPRIEMMYANGMGQINKLISIGGFQNPNSNFPRRFLCYGVNLAHLPNIVNGINQSLGWRGLECAGGTDSNVRFENTTDWLCGSQDVRGSINIVGEGSKLSFINMRALNPGTDEGHKLHANVNAGAGLPVGLDYSENWQVVTAPITDLQGNDVRGELFAEANVHAQAHQEYDDAYIVRRGRFVADDLDPAGVVANVVSAGPALPDPFDPAAYRVALADTTAINYNNSLGEYALTRYVTAITNAQLNLPSPYQRATSTIRGRSASITRSAFLLAPTSTRDENRDRDRTADFFVIDGRSLTEDTGITAVDIILDGALLVAKENRRDGFFDGQFAIVNAERAPEHLTAIRVWTRNCVIWSDVPTVRLVDEEAAVPVEFYTWDGQPGLDAWIYNAPTSPSTQDLTRFAFTDQWGNEIPAAQWEQTYPAPPLFGVDPGLIMPAAIAPPALPLDLVPGALMPVAPGTGPAPTGAGLAPGIDAHNGSAPLEPTPRYGPFGFGQTQIFAPPMPAASVPNN